jgi:hypothetical protein
LTGDVDSQSKRALAEEIASTVLNVQQSGKRVAGEGAEGHILQLIELGEWRKNDETD